ncbi:olfactory receptor 6M1-like [Panulirus ornatus]|uniref:olfactory receptor 6M1-like n=1 Tax=Panulirus ornatus TaxID=150431 RepID=UPI003A8AD241
MSEQETSQERNSLLSLDIFYLTISVLTLVECAFTFFINSSNKTLRKRATTSFANNLAASIGVLSSVSFVCNAYFIAESSFTEVPWACIVLAVFVRYLHLVSCLTLACLSLDRYVAICWPLHYQYLLTRIRCRLLCLACWVIPCVLLLLPCASELQTICSRDSVVSLTFLLAYTVIYSLGAVATFIFYILVALEFRRERGGHAQDKERIERLLRTRTAKSAMRVFAFYILFSLPHTVFPLVQRALPNPQSLPTYLKDTFHVINRIHVLFFLPVYAWTNAIVQETLRAWVETLGDWLFRCPCLPQVLKAWSKAVGRGWSPCLEPQQQLQEDTSHPDGIQYP